MQSTLERMFERELAHGKEVYNMSTGKTVKVVIRSNTDRNKTDEKSTIMYPQNDSINQGDEIVYRGTHYLVLNKDARESDVYYKSDLMAMTVDAKIYDEDKKIVYLTKVYANDMNSASVSDLTYINTVNAAVSVIMPDNDAAKMITIDNHLTLWGYRYNVAHVVRKNGMCYIFGQFTLIDSPITAQSTACTNNLNSAETYVLGETVDVIATPTMLTNGNNYAIKCPDCKITYISSNENVAKFDGNKLSFVGVGKTTITTSYTCELLGLSGVSSVTIDVSNPNAYTISYTTKDGYKQLYTDYDDNTITAHLLKGGKEVTLPEGARVEWTHTFSGSATNEANYIHYSSNGLVLTIAIDYTLKVLSDVITVVCTVYNADGSVLAVGAGSSYMIVSA